MSRSVSDLVRLFDSLPAPSTDVGLGRFCAQPLPGFPACSVGKDTAQNPVLLIQADNASPAAASPLVLEHLSVIHLVNCRVHTPQGEQHDRTLSVIRCTGTDRAMHEYFLRALHSVVVALPRNPTQQDVSQAIQRLVELFRQLSEPPRKALQGLWAELFIIARASDPRSLIQCWHAMPEDRFDFSDGPQRLEVKTASGRVRSHRFALEQIRPAAGTVAVVASVLTERTAGGTSLIDLLDEIRNRIDDADILIRLDNVVARTIGTDWRHATDTRFDRQLAEDSLRFFDALSIPAVSTEVPPEVSDIHFRVDLSRQPSLVPTHDEAHTSLLLAAVPAVG